MSQPKFITHPSYDQLHNAAITITREARTLAWIDCVIAPVRGGMMFGAIASHKLNVPMIALHYSSKHGNGDDKNHQNILPELDQYKTLFLVDDIIDSGATLTEIVKFYTERGNKVITGSYHFKDGASFHPDLYFWRIPSDSEFIVYPYENC